MARSPRINIKLSDWALDEVQRLADEDGRSISSYCQRIIESHLQGGLLKKIKGATPAKVKPVQAQREEVKRKMAQMEREYAARGGQDTSSKIESSTAPVFGESKPKTAKKPRAKI